MLPQIILSYICTSNLDSVDSPLFLPISTICVLLSKLVFVFAFFKIISNLLRFITPIIKRVTNFFKQKIGQESDDSTIWLLVLLGFGLLFLALGLLLKEPIFAIGFLWGGVIILGGFLLGICIS